MHPYKCMLPNCIVVHRVKAKKAPSLDCPKVTVRKTYIKCVHHFGEPCKILIYE